MNAIDLHCHFIPPRLIERIRTDGGARGITVERRGDNEFVNFAGRDATQPFPKGMLDLEARLRWMDTAGIEVQVLSAWMDFSAYVLDAEDGRWLAHSLNELTAEAISKWPDRFRAMAAVPLQAPDLAAQELQTATDDLGMVGVEIATSVVDLELDDPGLEPFWAAAESSGLVVLVHPYSSIGADRLTRYFLANSVSNPAEETVAAAHLMHGGVLERHPELNICLTHGGGFLPFQIGRLDRGFVAKADLSRVHLNTKPSDLLRRFFYDTIVHSPEAVRYLTERVGHDRVVLGSDQPFPMGDPDPVGTVTAAGLSEEVQAAILRGNAARLIGLADSEILG